MKIWIHCVSTWCFISLLLVLGSRFTRPKVSWTSTDIQMWTRSPVRYNSRSKDLTEKPKSAFDSELFYECINTINATLNPPSTSLNSCRRTWPIRLDGAQRRHLKDAILMILNSRKAGCTQLSLTNSVVPTKHPYNLSTIHQLTKLFLKCHAQLMHSEMVRHDVWADWKQNKIKINK